MTNIYIRIGIVENQNSGSSTINLPTKISSARGGLKIDNLDPSFELG